MRDLILIWNAQLNQFMIKFIMTNVLFCIELPHFALIKSVI